MRPSGQHSGSRPSRTPPPGQDLPHTPEPGSVMLPLRHAHVQQSEALPFFLYCPTPLMTALV
jgi:hypothetical protein